MQESPEHPGKNNSQDKGHNLRSKICLGMLRTEVGIIQETQCTEIAREMVTKLGQEDNSLLN